MSIAELKEEVARLNSDERRQLTAYLIGLRHKEMQGYRESLAVKIDAHSPENWVSFEEFDLRISK